MINPVFEISNLLNGDTIAKDCTIYKSETDSSISLGDFKMSETAVLYSPIKRKRDVDNSNQYVYFPRYGNKSLGKELQSPYSFNININEDGSYRIFFAIMPTKDWYEKTISDNKSLIDSYIERDKRLYITDGVGIISVKKSKNEYVQETISFNEAIEDISESGITSSFIKFNDLVSVSNLMSCYLSLCKKILDCDVFSCCKKGMSNNGELIFKRDMVWLALNTIEILASRCNGNDECPELDEIEMIIERIGGCNGFCSEDSSGIHGSRLSCGCIK